MAADTKENLDNIRSKVAKFTFSLNSQTQVPLWSIANEDVIYSAAVGVKHSWTKKKIKLFYAFRFAGFLNGVADALIFICGLLIGTRLWLTLKKKTLFLKKYPQNIERIFAGFGASSENVLLEEYKQQSSKPFLYVNWTTHENEEKIGCPTLLSIILSIAKNSFGYSRQLKKLENVQSYKIDFLTVCAINVGRYAFYREFWKIAKLHNVHEVTFLTPDIELFACTDIGIKTIYLQHGLLALTLLIPRVSQIECVTEFEKNYLMTFCKNTLITKRPPKNPPCIVKKNSAFILSPDVHIHESKPVIERFIVWANQLNLQVILRPRPSINENDINILRHYYPSALIDDPQEDLENCIVKLSPKFVLSGSSTGLATALDYGLLPVSFCDPDTGGSFWKSTPNAWSNMIYPMYRYVLFWPRDQMHMSEVVHSTDLYNRQLDLLRSGCDLNVSNIKELSEG